MTQITDQMVEAARDTYESAGRTTGVTDKQRWHAALESALSAGGEAQGVAAEPVAWRVKGFAQDEWFIVQDQVSADACEVNGAPVEPLYAASPAIPQSAGLDAGIRLGSMTERSGGGKYEIVITFRNIDDMFACGKALVAARALGGPANG